MECYAKYITRTCSISPYITRNPVAFPTRMGDTLVTACMQRTEPLGNKGVNFIEMKLSFDSPIEMRCLYLTAIFDDYDQRQMSQATGLN